MFSRPTVLLSWTTKKDQLPKLSNLTFVMWPFFQKDRQLRTTFLRSPTCTFTSTAQYLHYHKNIFSKYHGLESGPKVTTPFNEIKTWVYRSNHLQGKHLKADASTYCMTAVTPMQIHSPFGLHRESNYDQRSFWPVALNQKEHDTIECAQ